jgi:hypothetical protein
MLCACRYRVTYIKAPSSYDGHSDAAAELCVAEKIYGTAHF